MAVIVVFTILPRIQARQKTPQGLTASISLQDVGGGQAQAPVDFVCEEDVRLAIQAGRKIVVSERAIVTPAALDLGEQHRVFSIAPWRG